MTHVYTRERHENKNTHFWATYGIANNNGQQSWGCCLKSRYEEIVFFHCTCLDHHKYTEGMSPSDSHTICHGIRCFKI